PRGVVVASIHSMSIMQDGSSYSYLCTLDTIGPHSTSQCFSARSSGQQRIAVLLVCVNGRCLDLDPLTGLRPLTQSIHVPISQGRFFSPCLDASCCDGGLLESGDGPRRYADDYRDRAIVG